jgi:hypothetical protein
LWSFFSNVESEKSASILSVFTNLMGVNIVFMKKGQKCFIELWNKKLGFCTYLGFCAKISPPSPSPVRWAEMAKPFCPTENLETHNIKSNNYMKDTTIKEMRIEFDQLGGRTLSFPVAGVIAWTSIAIFGFILAEKQASFAVFILNGLIFPLSLLLSNFFKENILSSKNELDVLFGRSVILVNLSWTIAIPFWMVLPSSLPLSVGVMAGLHWIVYGWIVQHWIGLFHAVSRALIVTTAWFIFPQHRFIVIPIIIVTIYSFTIYILATRKLNTV